jgi:mRNA interferase YafQ
MMEIKTTSKFRKDLKLAKKKGLNITLLLDVVDKLAAGKTRFLAMHSF